MLDINEEEKLEKERPVLNQKISVTVNGIKRRMDCSCLPKNMVSGAAHSIPPRAEGSTSPFFEKINIKCQLIRVA